MRRLAPAVLIGLALVGCHHEAAKALTVEVPSVAVLRSLLPADMRIQLPPIDPKKDGRLMFERAIPHIPTKNFDFQRYASLKDLRSNAQKCAEDLRPWNRAPDIAVAATQCPDWSSGEAGDSELDAHFFDPEVTEREPNTNFNVAFKAKDLAMALLIRARLRSAQGSDACIDDYLASNRLAMTLMSGRGPFIDYLIGVAVLDMDLRRIQFDALNLSIPTLKALLARLGDEQQFERGYAECQRAELDNCLRYMKLSVRDTIADISKKSPATYSAIQANPHPFDAEQTVVQLSNYFKFAMAGATLPYFRRPDFERAGEVLYGGLPEFQENWTTPLTNDQLRNQFIKVGNPLGRLVSGQLVWAGISGNLFKFLVASKAEVAATRILLACQLFRRGHGSFPASLQILVNEKLIPTLPLDPFDGKPFRYDAKRAIVWVVGEDLREDGGHDRPFIGPMAKDKIWALDGHKDAR